MIPGITNCNVIIIMIISEAQNQYAECHAQLWECWLLSKVLVTRGFVYLIIDMLIHSDSCPVFSSLSGQEREQGTNL